MQLNLARKWRSQTFSTIIGQELVVRILKNGLFSDCFFPVYLFAGTHGCGKTTTARVFAAAANCSNLSVFQQDPSKNEIPCLKCRSCELMMVGKHPDFIEMDAASHTGVDNVREIIEAASLLPVLGRKKIYLIDEAHMLSKAAFNAFLKILEEPPQSAFFMLATTETQKIIDTVRSRCFQLFFQPVAVNTIIEHLKVVCDAEEITYEEAGLEVIACEAHGSVRDGINILERVRFSAPVITKDAVLSTLQHIDTSYLVELLEYVCLAEKQDVALCLASIKLERFSQPVLWKKLVEIVQSVLWLSYGIERPQIAFVQEKERLKKLAAQCSQARLIAMLEKLYFYEQIFLKTTAQSSLIQLVLLALCEDKLSNDADRSGSSRESSKPKNLQPVRTQVDDSITNNLKPLDVPLGKDSAPHENQWQAFLTRIDQELSDPLVSSIFRQAKFDRYDTQQKVIKLNFAKKLSFFSSMLTSTQQLWQPILNQVFGEAVVCQPSFSENNDQIKPIEVAHRPVEKPKDSIAKEFAQKPVVRSATHLKQGKHAKLLLEAFPGTLSLIKEGYE